jgi:hypothetical protein
VVADFLLGKPWLAHVEPVVHHIPRTIGSGIQVLGEDSEGDASFNFHQSRAEATLAGFLKAWVRTRHSWWDRENSEDETAQQFMSLMPMQCQTALASAFMTYDGKQRFAVFATWNQQPSEDSNSIALPFVTILGGYAFAALAIRKVRSIEQSQISYSNLQAQ